MERDEFISKFGIGLLAVCAGCGLSACGGSKSDAPTPTTPTTPVVVTPPAGSGNVFSTDLNSEITTVGASKVASNIILVRIAAGNTATSFTAVQVNCTHEGTAINYNNAQGIFICPLHGSQFGKNGNLLLGPAASALKQYTISITGTTLNVVA